ncbi:heavy metal-associated domain-containing protein [Marispirochaeta sp.]|jgi:copper chaperone CopZ|uniref:heavy-metal-associated domain-containing protein n=1 Tax=Marispirochaeta sp. TaxID=2038653 RepID=UPI0029C9391F|nr:heavy metal-associated domain-containing protein [Marispirochaeta sp.]
MKTDLERTNSKQATLKLSGATCTSCVFTIEHAGRKVQGVGEVSVDAGKGEINVTYGGNAGSLERIKEIVHRLGYSAEIDWDTVRDA